MLGMPLMVLLGVGVRDGATPVDAWMQQAGSLAWLTVFTDQRTAEILLLTALAVSVYRRLWALLPVIVVLPLLAVGAARALKPVFGRFKEDALAYPSGHTALMIAVLGALILAVGARRWLLWSATVFAALGVAGQAVSYHYFTDAVGSVLLGTSLVCIAAVLLRRADRRLRRLGLRL